MAHFFATQLRLSGHRTQRRDEQAECLRRLAQVVARGREKVALGAVGGLGAVFGNLQLLAVLQAAQAPAHQRPGEEGERDARRAAHDRHELQLADGDRRREVGQRLRRHHPRVAARLDPLGSAEEAQRRLAAHAVDHRLARRILALQLAAVEDLEREVAVLAEGVAEQSLHAEGSEDPADDVVAPLLHRVERRAVAVHRPHHAKAGLHLARVFARQRDLVRGNGRALSRPD